ncbi:unnamed protein product [Symbiodinium sp. CCMP2592]|nr:unnamed protein product [Symbiodinium sp. CCMP2592]
MGRGDPADARSQGLLLLAPGQGRCDHGLRCVCCIPGFSTAVHWDRPEDCCQSVAL